MPLLDVTDAQVTIGNQQILHGADLAVDPGQLIAVVGPNGAGKSTLARAAAGLQKLSGGSVLWDGVPIRSIRARRLAQMRSYVPQRPRVPEGIVVREAVLIGRSPHLRPLERLGAGDRRAADQAMERAGVLAFADRALTTLSGGELQRVQIAIGLAQETPVVIADEPTSALDLGATSAMATLLRSLADDGLAIVLVVHDLALAAAVADTVIVISEGHSVACGPPNDVLVPEMLQRVWHVAAELETDGLGRTALHVRWLGGAAARSGAESSQSGVEG